MAEIQQRLAQVREKWNAVPARLRAMVLLGIAVAAGVSLFVYARNQNPTMTVLFSNLESQDAAQIVERLRDMRIPYELDAGGTAVLVPEQSVHETRLTLSAEGLPSGGGVGFEIFDEQRFGESEFAEQVKYHRALEGELARTISHMSGVEHARVHLVLPNRSLFRSAEPQASASVVLNLRPGWRMSENQVRGIVHMVASSVRGLEAERVTLVDGAGRKLAGGSDDERDEEQAGNVLAYRRDVERAKEESVQNLLDRTLGLGRAIVRVSADVNFAREERTEEKYEPQTIATRSFQITEERDAAGNNTTQGIPGAASNLPGGEAPQQTSGGSDSFLRRSETRNFEVSKTVRRAIEPVGRIDRLNVAVVVDGSWTGVGAKRKFKPVPDRELTRIGSIVQSAVGANAERGDRVTVECVPFAESTKAADPTAEAVDPLAKYKPYLPYAAAGLGALFVLVLLMMMLRRKRKKGSDPRMLPGPTTSAALESGLSDPHLREKALAGETTAVHEEARLLAAELAGHNPELAARVIRGWLTESGQ